MPTSLSPKLNLPIPGATSNDIRASDIVAVKNAIVNIDTILHKHMVDNPPVPAPKPTLKYIIQLTSEHTENSVRYYNYTITGFGVPNATFVDVEFIGTAQLDFDMYIDHSRILMLGTVAKTVGTYQLTVVPFCNNKSIEVNILPSLEYNVEKTYTPKTWVPELV